MDLEAEAVLQEVARRLVQTRDDDGPAVISTGPTAPSSRALDVLVYYATREVREIFSSDR
ncbi:hypothetical protein [Actinacidiphila oryziradicis]|uniref:hypothetical protein n=1 Tax=Actinacidiphila oryziradicis TaxID=2571141 RepID=UPI0023EF72E3|nr:hypothetical protein [Actinacidiphila oryziradicis]